MAVNRNDQYGTRSIDAKHGVPMAPPMDVPRSQNLHSETDHQQRIQKAADFTKSIEPNLCDGAVKGC